MNERRAVAWGASAWWLCGVDGPLPIGDVVYVAGLAATGLISVKAVSEISSVRTTNNTVSLPRKKTKEEIAMLKETHAVARAAIKIRNKAKRKRKKYFEVHMSRLPKTKLMTAVLGKAITRAKAIARLKTQKSTITYFGYNAKSIASVASCGRKPIQHIVATDNEKKMDIFSFLIIILEGKMVHILCM